MAGKFRPANSEDEGAEASSGHVGEAAAESGAHGDSEDHENAQDAGDDSDSDAGDDEEESDGIVEDEDASLSDDESGTSEDDVSDDEATAASTTGRSSNRGRRKLLKFALEILPMCIQSYSNDSLAVGTVDGQLQLYKLAAPQSAATASITTKPEPTSETGNPNSFQLETRRVLNLNRSPTQKPSEIDSVRALCLGYNYNSVANGSSTGGASSSSGARTMLAASKFGRVNVIDLERNLATQSIKAFGSEVVMADQAICCMLALNAHATAIGFDTGKITIIDDREMTHNEEDDSDNGVVLKLECDSKDQIADMLLDSDGHTLLVAGGDGCLYSMDTRSRKQLLVSERFAEFTSLAAVGRGGSGHVVASSLDGRLYIFNHGQYGAPSDIYGNHETEINSIVSYTGDGNDDGNLLVTGDADGHIRLLHLFPHKQVAYVGKQESVEHMSVIQNFADSGKQMLFAASQVSEDLFVWDISKFDELMKDDDAESKRESSTSGTKRNPGDSSDDDSGDDDKAAGSSSRGRGGGKDDKKSRKMPKVDKNKTKNEDFFADM